MRISGLDLSRSFAVLLAMLVHALVAFEVSVPFDLLFRVATPAFLIMFGVFLEIVYFRKYRAGQREAVERRLLVRALQCATLHTFAAIVLGMAENYSIAYTFRVILFLGYTPFTDILKLYAIALLLAPALLWLRFRMPLGLLLAGAALLHPMLAITPWPSGDHVGLTALGLLFGAPSDAAGPSVIHAMILVLFGMLLGSFVKDRSGGASLLGRQARQPNAILFGLILAFASLAAIYPDDLLLRLSDMTLRNMNHPLYFLFGMIASMALIDLSMRLAMVMPDSACSVLSILGRTSLFTFGFGNAFLYVMMGESETPAISALLAFMAVVAGSYLFAFLDPRIRARDGQIADAYRWLASGYAARLVARVRS